MKWLQYHNLLVFHHISHFNRFTNQFTRLRWYWWHFAICRLHGGSWKLLCIQDVATCWRPSRSSTCRAIGSRGPCAVLILEWTSCFGPVDVALSLLQITVCYYTFYKYWDASSVLYTCVWLAILFCYTRTSVFFHPWNGVFHLFSCFSPPPCFHHHQICQAPQFATCAWHLSAGVEFLPRPWPRGFVMIFGFSKVASSREVVATTAVGESQGYPPSFSRIDSEIYEIVDM